MSERVWETIQSRGGKPVLKTCRIGEHCRLRLVQSWQHKLQPYAWNLYIELEVNGAQVSKKHMMHDKPSDPDWDELQDRAIRTAKESLHQVYRDLSKILDDFTETGDDRDAADT